jgi:hypothetical protein
MEHELRGRATAALFVQRKNYIYGFERPTPFIYSLLTIFCQP